MRNNCQKKFKFATFPQLFDMNLQHFYRSIQQFRLWRCPVCDSLQYGRFMPVCPLCVRLIPLYEDMDVHDNGVLRLLWSACDVRAGGALFHYYNGDDVHRIIHLVKYYRAFRLGEELGAWLCQKLRMKEWSEKIEVVVPVPMNKRRAKQYGYNPAFYIARGIAKQLGCRVEEWLERTDSFSSQTRMSVRERQERTIHLHAHIPRQERGKCVLLVDDVITTGSTLRQCATALLSCDSQMTLCVAAVGCVLAPDKCTQKKPHVAAESGEDAIVVVHDAEPFDE